MVEGKVLDFEMSKNLYCWKSTYTHSYTFLHTKTSKKINKREEREQTITSSGRSLSQAKLTTAQGVFSMQVHLLGVNVKKKKYYGLEWLKGKKAQ